MMKKVYSIPIGNSGLIKYMERTKAAHLVSIRFPLMASSVLFPDLELEAGMYVAVSSL